MCTQKFRKSEQVFILTFFATALFWPLVLESEYQEREIGPPAGSVRLKGYFVLDLIECLFTVQYDTCGSQ